jgi:aminomethyltransferase
MHGSRTTPLHDIHTALGARFTGFAGWLMPLRYGSDVAEHRAVREASGLFDLTHMGEIEISGPEAARYLDYALVGHLSKARVGRARYTMLCHENGGVLDDLVVYRLAERRYLVVANASRVAVVVPELRDRANGFDVEVRDRSAEYALLAVQGPRSAEIVNALTDGDVGRLGYYAITETRLAGPSVLLGRTGYTGEDGFEVFCKPADAPGLWQALSKAGVPYGLQVCGLSCRDTLRLEAGMPLYGNELHVGVTPFEAGLGRVVEFGKPGNFAGRAALAARRDSGVASILVGLVARGRRVPRHGHYVVDPDSGAMLGTVTSGAPSPTRGVPIAMAYVPPAHAGPGTRLHVDVRGTPVPAEVVRLPFYRRTH